MCQQKRNKKSIQQLEKERAVPNEIPQKQYQHIYLPHPHVNTGEHQSCIQITNHICHCYRL